MAVGILSNERNAMESVDDTSTYYIIALATPTEYKIAIFFSKWRSPRSGALQELDAIDDHASFETEEMPVREDSDSDPESICELYSSFSQSHLLRVA